MSSENNLLILGASARAAAFSALAAGFSPVCGDAFADADLARVCPATAAARYPVGLVELARAAPPGPWMYTGALENHGALVSRISATRPLLGNDARVLARVRDPFAVADALAAAGLSAPALWRASNDLPLDGSWLRKSLHSSGGAGVIPWTPPIDQHPADKQPTASRRFYFQQRIEGVSCAAIYLATGGVSLLLGASEQLFAPKAPFRYVGSVGPRPLSAGAADRLRRIGATLAAEFRLTGLFGVDYIDDGRDLWPVEINPRYTASVEILERAMGFSAVAWHATACQKGRFPEAVPAHSMSLRANHPAWFAKRIVSARRHAVVEQSLTDELLAQAQRNPLPTIADIPRAGTELLPGKPILTFFGQGNSREEALAEIDRASAFWSNKLPI